MQYLSWSQVLLLCRNESLEVYQLSCPSSVVTRCIGLHLSCSPVNPSIIWVVHDLGDALLSQSPLLHLQDEPAASAYSSAQYTKPDLCLPLPHHNRQLSRDCEKARAAYLKLFLVGIDLDHARIQSRTGIQGQDRPDRRTHSFAGTIQLLLSPLLLC